MKIVKVGDKISMLEVLEEAPRSKWGIKMWACKCDCGKLASVRDDYLKRGRSKSCGCYGRDRKWKHGMTGTRFYENWRNMNMRTTNPRISCFKRYGGRGIIVCERWKDFINFKEDMYSSYIEHKAEYPNEGTTIERIDNDGNYEPKNCRWATSHEQFMNTGRTIFRTETTKVCTKCRKQKLYSEFYKHSRKVDGYTYSCRECHANTYKAKKEVLRDVQKALDGESKT